ncbi:retinol dehydrogenase 12-like [Chiloscyllium plagiosum]|uniref:retinol dehydrogenase 12-like n=1 Tax=Chiloscyllium plagiosum TaxID=36176 RepID=UPI001CB85B02|nr:retinol dehydrogenase 12-like [Chiloscyllium plagiosum]
MSIQKSNDMTCRFNVPTGIGLGFLRHWFSGGVCKSKTRLDGKTVIVTGANIGIGKETAKDLAQRGARVILACRDLEKAGKAAKEIRKASGNGNVVVQKLDLASLQSVRSFANKITETETRLDILINNAGKSSLRCWKKKKNNLIHTKSYNLLGFQNYFQFSFWQMQSIIDSIIFSCFINDHPSFTRSRVGIFVDDCTMFSTIHIALDTGEAYIQMRKTWSVNGLLIVLILFSNTGKINFDDINLDNCYDPAVSYEQSKLANVLFTRELAKKLKDTGVTANCLHPGVIQTELIRHLYPTLSIWLKILLVPLSILTFKSVQQGAQTSIYCAVSEELDNVSGLYFSDCAVKATAPQGRDDDAAKRLWELSEKMVGLESEGQRLHVPES